ncbi:MAG: DUF1552 domain-containing protein [Myxococcota bacterium]
MKNTTQRWADTHLTRFGRRWFLTTAGVAIALPCLETLDPQQARAQTATGAKRLFLFHMPAGVNVSTWVPSGSGTNFTFGQAMTPVTDANLKAKVTVVTGTSAIGGPRGHTCGISGVLTGVQCQGNTSSNAISFDQVVAQAWSGKTRFSSLELGTSHNTENPNAESGYSTVIKDNLNWSNATTPLSREVEPLKAFNRLFSGIATTPGGPAPTLAFKDAMKKSVLDYALAQGDALSKRLSKLDRAKLDQYLSGIRDLERTIQNTPTMGQTGECTPGAAPSAGRPSDIQAHVKLMLDIIVQAFKCDLTRVATFAYEHTTTEIRHTFLNVSAGWHSGVTHHGNAAGALANYTTVNRWMVSQYVYVLKQLDAISDGTGTMLDNSACMLFSELSDGNSHSNQNMPVLLAGSAGGRLQTGRAVAGSGVIEQVHLAMMQALGLSATTFGRARGPLPGLLA